MYSTHSDFYLESRVASDSEKADMEAKMTAAHRVIKKCHEKVNEVSESHYSKQKFRSELFKVINEKKVEVRGVVISAKDVQAVRTVKDMEYQILTAFNGLIIETLLKVARNQPQVSANLQDFYNEALLAATNAMYSFDGEEACFTTFIATAVRNRVLQAVLDFKPVTPWTQTDRELVMEFYKIQKTSPHLSEDAVISQMGLTEKNRLVVRHLISSYGDRSLEVSTKNKDVASPANEATLSAEDTKKLDAIEKIRGHLSGLEAKLLEICIECNNEWGWQSTAAEKLGCTRQHIGNTWTRLKAKIQRVYNPSFRKAA